MEKLIKERRNRELNLEIQKNEISSGCYQSCSFPGQVLQIISLLYNKKGSK